MLSKLIYVSIAIAVVAIALAGYSILKPTTITKYVNNTVTTKISTSQMPLTLANVNVPLNSTELAIINNAPNSYFEYAGELYLNHSLVDQVGTQANSVPALIINNKTSVIYLGSTTCIFCGENRWAMALALSRFGSFSSLYKGYSSYQDGNVRTLYWNPANLNTSTVDLGASYSSKYVNFIAIEDTGPITGGFTLQPLATIQQEINSQSNSSYAKAMNLIISLNNFQGTPYTIWGRFNVGGADAVDFGNTTPSSASNLPIAQMTHAQILNQFASGTSQFALADYAAADIYIAMTCTSINNTASVCALPAIQKIQKANGYV